MDISTKKLMLNVLTIIFLAMILMLIYKVILENYSLIGSLVNGLFMSIGYGLTYLVLSHDINKFERWNKEAIEFTSEGIAIVSDLSLSSTRENGRNTVILSAKYNDHELSFSGVNPDFQFKYKVGDEIKIRVHPEDSQRFVLDDLK
jgi:hypothetical protein